MKKWIATVMLSAVAAFVGAGCGESSSSSPSKTAPAGAKYICSMDGGQRETPGPCPKCGMELPHAK